MARVPAGEASKSLAAAEQVYEQLAAAEIDRQDWILALGGGMVGDLAGFVAATWMRGIRYIQMPTTLLACIDASVGGKTAVNTRAGKNLVGAFHQPSAVIIDLEFLATLPQSEFVAGLAESVKHAAIRDPEFFGWQEGCAAAILQRKPETLLELVARNCTIKAAIVSEDERESGPRAMLNYGHTVGHGIEHASGYSLRHGECVALGMLAENAIARERQALPPAAAQRIRGLVEALGLPTRLPRGCRIEEVLAACRLDKKNRGGAIHAVLLRDLGAPQRVANLSAEEIARSLATLA